MQGNTASLIAANPCSEASSPELSGICGKINLGFFGAFGGPTLSRALTGALAGALTGVATCPLDVVRTRLQTATAADAAGGAAGIARAIWLAHGLGGFWAGVGARVATLSPLMAAILGGYEVLKRACVKG